MALFFAPALFAQVTINVDAAANRHPINPNVYGVAFATTAQLLDLNVPLNRSGGNATTRYNWQLNASNHAADWFFESIGETSALAGESADTFIRDTKAGGAQPMITIPILGWTAKLGPNRGNLASFSVAKYGAQQYTDPYMPDAGNGVRANGSEVAGNDPNDANMPVDALFQQAWVQHLVAQWGGVRYYLLDNEPSIWHATHRDVHPTGATMDEVLAKMRDHAQRIRAADLSALICGPEEWGWGGYFYSGYDQQWAAAHDWSSFPDRVAHGGADSVPWLVSQMRGLLDVVTVHYYPQSGEFSDDVSTAMQLLRNRSTRSLWDPNYVDESWIGDKVRLIPRMREWAGGLPVGITEYNWGAESDMNGATAQADVLGIFGRAGLDLAARWTTPDAGSPAYDAIKIYRNYDGVKSSFGDTSVSASGTNPDSVAVFAAQRSSDGALTVMIVTKVLSGTTPATVKLANFTAAASAQRWQLAAGTHVVRLADLTSLSLTLP
ncbi:MAG TPA: glycoside hydrolase family 44 protein, partial [Thermoanaerobaculia bacterium]|nr:glycoside hydrolase family 44 protein [Thermoanaerobaculia bacterium]